MRFEIKSLNLGEILDEAFRLFRHGFWSFLFFELLFAVPAAVGFGFLIQAAGALILEMARTGDISWPLVAKATGAALGGFLLLGCLVAPISAVALTSAVAETYLGRGFSVGTMLRHAVRLGPRAVVVWSGVLACILGIIIATCAFMLGGAFLLIGGALMSGGLTAMVGFALLALATLLVVVLGCGYLYLRFLLSLTALAVEDLGIRAAFTRSAELMRGRYLGALGLLAVLFAVSALTSGAISAFIPTPSFEKTDLETMKVLLPELIRSQILSSTLGQIVGSVTGIYGSICWTLFYFTARCDKEGFDLSYLAERLGGEPGRPVGSERSA